MPRLAASLRATTWAVAPLTAAVASHWIRDGTADALLAARRQEARERQAIARERLAGADFDTKPEAYYLWLRLPEPWRSDALRGRGAGARRSRDAGRGVRGGPRAGAARGAAVHGRGAHARGAAAGSTPWRGCCAAGEGRARPSSEGADGPSNSLYILARDPAMIPPHVAPREEPPMRTLAVAAFAVALAVPAAVGEEVKLFNGKDLSGWTFFLDKSGPNADGSMKMEDVWKVDGGKIRCSGVPNGYIRTTARLQGLRPLPRVALGREARQQRRPPARDRAPTRSGRRRSRRSSRAATPATSG